MTAHQLTLAYYICVVYNFIYSSWMVYKDYKTEKSMRWGNILALVACTFAPVLNFIVFFIFAGAFIFHVCEDIFDNFVEFLEKPVFKQRNLD